MVGMFYCYTVVDSDEFSVGPLQYPRVSEILVTEFVDLEIVPEDNLVSPCFALVAAEAGNHLVLGAITVNTAKSALFQLSQPGRIAVPRPGVAYLAQKGP